MKFKEPHANYFSEMTKDLERNPKCVADDIVICWVFYCDKVVFY